MGRVLGFLSHIGMALLIAAGVLAAPALVHPALAQGKRLALVIGIGEYPNVPHPTALADAGLITSALTARGFEVIQSGNPDQAEFRARFREFLDRAHAAGPDAIIALAISGFALQDDGENYLIPHNARIAMRPDFATEALRLSDFLRALSAIPSQKRLAFLDLGYQNPYLALLPDGGRGLTQPERQAGTLIALNTAPGQAAALPQSSYGPFAMALAEAIAEPGLEASAMMERVRLRVHDLTKGADTPFAISGLTEPLMLDGAASPAAATPPAASPPATIAGLSAEEDYARAVQRDSIAGYEAFLRAHPDHPLAKRVRAMLAQRREAAFWSETRRVNSERAYWTYLRHYPRGTHAGEARRRLDRMQASVAPPQGFDEVIYDDLAPPPAAEIDVIERVVIEEVWEPLPPGYAMPLAVLPPPPVAIIEAPPPPAPLYPRLLPAVPLAIGAAILARRAWVRPPDIRPAWTPPPRPRGPIMPVGQPPQPRPPGPPMGGIAPQGVPQPNPGLVPSAVVPPGAIRPGQPPVATPQPGVPQPPPGLRPTIPGQPGVALPPRPTSPGANPPPPQPQPPATATPGATPPATTPPGTPPPAAVAPKPLVAQPGIARPDPLRDNPASPRARPNPEQRPPVQRQPSPRGEPMIRVPRPGEIRPVERSLPGARGPNSMPPSAATPQRRPAPQANDPLSRGAPGYRPAPPAYRPPLGNGANPPSGRPAPPIYREPSQQPMRQPQAQPQFRQAPPIARPTPPTPPQQPQFRTAPPPQPQARPAPQPQQRQQPQCTPQMRAARIC